MGLIREPKSIDFVIESKPWTEDELVEFRALIKKNKEERKAKIQQKVSVSKRKAKVIADTSSPIAKK
ncbi:hypothetical protein [Larkinella terrae]|uniref:Uncharacterized protein n=1 Tax=Larkinella terrae TaxID=2025311 RepID=A0A7K0EVF0_9BACT|nr:hypothetical protein [Larkinella terrae]MRS65471.1 hypothetical protein [Larkinella terrae]